MPVTKTWPTCSWISTPVWERRRQLATQVKKMAEDARVATRNERRDANKHIDSIVKDKTSPVSEDSGKDAKDEIEGMTKKHIARIEDLCNKKVSDVEEL